MLTLAMLWLCEVGNKDDVENAKELFKFVLVSEATCSFQPLEPNATPIVPPHANDDVDVHVYDDDNVFDMVNVSLPSQDIESGVSSALDTVTLGDLANKALKEWISLKVD
jgi:hypothetical protein